MSWSTPVELAPDPANGNAPCGGNTSPEWPYTQPPISYGGNLYIMLATANIFGFAGVWKSTDGGRTWAGPLDSAHAPAFNSSVPVFDGAHTWNVIYCTATVPLGPDGPATVRTFDLATELWGVDNGSTAGSYTNISGGWLRSDGSIISLLCRQSSGSSRLQTYFAGIWKSGVWTVELSLMANFPGPSNLRTGPAGVLDSSDVLYAFLGYEQTPAGFMICQVVTALGTLGPFFNFPAGIQSISGATTIARPCIFQSKIVVPCYDPVVFRASFYTSPLSVPNFTYSGIFADPDASFQSVGFELNCTTDGSKIYLAYMDSTENIIRLCTSPDLSTWTAETAFPGPVSGGLGEIPIYWPDLLLLTFQGSDPISSDQVLFATSRTLPPAPPPTAPMLGGGSSGRFRCCAPGGTIQNRQLAELARHMKHRTDSWPYLHVFPDRLSLPQQPVGRIAAPAVGVLTPVLVYQVPTGFRFYLEGIVNDFEGAAFNPGDSLWTVDQGFQVSNVQGAGVQGLVGLPVPLGSYTFGRWWKLPRVYEFAALTVLRAAVKNVNLLAGLPNVFSSAFIGWLEPVR